MALISGEQRKKGQFLRGTETILGNREYKKTKFEGNRGTRQFISEEQGNMYPLRGLRILIRRQNTTKVMAYILLEIRHCYTSNDVQTNASA